MIEVRILGLGLIGPGLSSWEAGRRVLQGEVEFEPGDVTPPIPSILTPRQRRRASAAVRLALAAADEAVRHAGLDPTDLSSVFGWAHGDGVVVQRILEALATPERHVSPTDFHNSVHNVAVGYWTIGTGCHQACSSVAAHKQTFPSSLLKAAAQVECEQTPLLLAVLDTPFVEPLNSVCPAGGPFAFALALAPSRQDGGLARVRVVYANKVARNVERPRTAGLRELWRLNAAASALPLLEHLARRETANLHLPYGPSARIELEVEPC